MALAGYQARFDQLMALNFPGLMMLVGRTLKDMGTFSGTDIQWPKVGDASEIVRMWLTDRLRITPIELIAADVPDALPVGAALQNEWWRNHGIQLIHKWHRSIHIDRDESHAFVKHKKALGRDELDDLLAHHIWPLWTAAIDADDFLAAQAIHDGNDDMAKNLARAFYCYSEAGSPKPPETDYVGRRFQLYLSKAHGLLETLIEGTYQRAFPREPKRNGLGSQLRILLTNFDNIGPSTTDAIAVIASTVNGNVTAGNLAGVSSLLFAKCLRLTIQMQGQIFGARLGRDPEAAITAVVEKWTEVDPLFEKVTIRYSAVSNSAFGFYSENIIKRMTEWFGHFWDYLKLSLVIADAMTLSVFFSEA
jgi:hypothetical protein